MTFARKNVHLAVLFVCFALSVCQAAAFITTATDEIIYVFGVNLGLNASLSGSYYPSQIQSLQGYILWRDWWNALPSEARMTKWGVPFRVELHVEEYSDFNYGDYQIPELLQVYANMAANTSIDFYFDTSSFGGDPVREYAFNTLNISMMMAPLDSGELYYSTPGSFGVPTANILAMTSWFSSWRIAGAQTISVVQVNDEIYQSEMCGGVVAQAAQNGLNVTSYFDSMPFDWYTMGGNITGEHAKTWKSTIDVIRQSSPDVVVICDYTYGAEFSLNYMREIGWLPKFVVISPLYFEFDDPSLLDYVGIIAPYHASANFISQENFTDSKGFDALSLAKFGVHASIPMAEATLAGMLYTNMLTSSPTNSSSDLFNTMCLSQFQSFMGLNAFDNRRRQTRPPLNIQLLNSGNTSHVTGPPLAAVYGLIYPMPSWDERIFDPKWGSAVEIVGVILMALGTLFVFVLAAFLIKFWSHKIMIAASPVFCLAVLIGALMIYISIFSWMPNLINDSVCNLRAWLLPLGFMTMFSSLIAKTDRVFRLYNQRGVTIIKITNLQVALRILVLLVIQSVLSILMITVTDLKAEIRIVDEYSVAKNFWVCTFSQPNKILFGINVAYAGLLLAYGTFLAYKIRSVPIAIYDESKIIGFSIYNTAFFAVIVIVIQLAVSGSNRQVTFIVTAACCFLGATITTATLFGAKWWAIRHPVTVKISSGRGGTSAGTISGSSGSNGGLNSSNTEKPPAHRDDGAFEQKYKQEKRKRKALKKIYKLKEARVKQLEEICQRHNLIGNETITSADSDGETVEERGDAMV